VTGRLPERMLLGSVAVPDIVLTHRVSNPDRVTGGVARWPTPTEDSSRDIPKAGPGAVGSFYTRNNFRTTPTRLWSAQSNASPAL
jgi:hypothetical protein